MILLRQLLRQIGFCQCLRRLTLTTSATILNLSVKILEIFWKFADKLGYVIAFVSDKWSKVVIIDIYGLVIRLVRDHY